MSHTSYVPAKAGAPGGTDLGEFLEYVDRNVRRLLGRTANQPSIAALAEVAKRARTAGWISLRHEATPALRDRVTWENIGAAVGITGAGAYMAWSRRSQGPTGRKVAALVAQHGLPPKRQRRGKSR